MLQFSLKPNITLPVTVKVGRTNDGIAEVTIYLADVKVGFGCVSAIDFARALAEIVEESLILS